MTHSENIKLLESYRILELARNDLLNGKLTPDEYFQLCESHEVNVDSYRENVEHNLIELKLI